MEEGTAATTYWYCHMCQQVVNPVMQTEPKCPFCHSGFLEQMNSPSATRESEIASDPALSLTNTLLAFMGDPRRRWRSSRQLLDHDEDDHHYVDDADRESQREGESEMEREYDSFIRRRRRISAPFLHLLLQLISAGLVAESDNQPANGRSADREHVVHAVPYHQTIVVQGSSDLNQNENHYQSTFGSFGDSFISHGLDLLLQHLAENDPNRYGTPPAQKEAVEALPTVKIEENLQCSVCLDEFDFGAEAKELPCKHRFHSACLLPWLELHSSCPVCRYQLPADESKSDTEATRHSTNVDEAGSGAYGERVDRNGSNRTRFLPGWPSSFFSSSGHSSTAADSSSVLPAASSSPSSTAAPGPAAQSDGS